MRPQRPYLLRALYEWIVDSDEIPYVLVDAQAEGVQVPTDYVENGQIVLNIGPNATRDLSMENEYVMFNSRFGGHPFEIILPMASIRAIYCKDTGEGMVFPDEDLAAWQSTPEQPSTSTQPATQSEGLAERAESAESATESNKKDKPPHLKLV